MYYLIGAAHRAHLINEGESPTEAQLEFTRCLTSAIDQWHPSLVGEEAAAQTLRRNFQQSLTKRVSDAKQVEHRFCDPDDDEREAMGYKDRMTIGLELSREWGLSPMDLDAKAGAIEIACFFPVREKFWLNRLNGFYEKDVVFVCGDFHIDGFAKLLANSGIPHAIIQRAIGTNEEDTRRMRIAVKYLTQHPEILSLC
jgi:hypothetical protein